MAIFEDIQDVEEWLAPLDYVAFWDAVAPYNLILQERCHCDGLIAGGIVEMDLILKGLKFMAMLELRQVYNLQHRIPEPVTAKYLMAIH